MKPGVKHILIDCIRQVISGEHKGKWEWYVKGDGQIHSGGYWKTRYEAIDNLYRWLLMTIPDRLISEK